MLSRVVLAFAAVRARLSLEQRLVWLTVETFHDGHIGLCLFVLVKFLEDQGAVVIDHRETLFQLRLLRCLGGFHAWRGLRVLFAGLARCFGP